MNFCSDFVRAFPRASRILLPLTARLKPIADAAISSNEVRLVLGAEILSAPVPLNEVLPQAAEQVVDVLLELLDKSSSRIGRLRLVASDYWLRPLVMRLGDDTLNDDELEAVLMHQYRQLFGKLMAGWSCRWDRQPNALILAMAWPDALLEVRSQLAKRGIRLVSALPQSLTAIRELSIPIGPAWFAYIGADCITFIRQDKEGWEHWRTVSAVVNTAELVSSQLLRLVAQLDDGCRDVWIQAPGFSSDWLGELRRLLATEGWRLNLPETVN